MAAAFQARDGSPPEFGLAVGQAEYGKTDQEFFGAMNS
jgi:hypothetical protein